VTGEAAELDGGFSRRALGWIVGGVVVSFVAAVLLGVYGRDLDPRPAPGTDTFSYSALGHRALADFLRAMGLGVVSRQAAGRGGLGPNHPLIVAEPRDAAALRTLRGEAVGRRAPLVLVLPKWEAGAPRQDKPEWLASVTLLPAAEAERIAGALAPPAGRSSGRAVAVRRTRGGGGGSCSAAWDGLPAGLRIDSRPAQLLKPGPGLEPVVTCPGGLLIARLGLNPPAYLIADPDILNNQGLGRGDNAEAVYAFLARGLGATGVVFDETIHGFHRTPGLLAEALRFPLVLGVAQSLVLLGIVLWAGMGRFGKPLPAPTALAAGKATLIDNTAKLLAEGGHAGDSLARYFRQTTRAVAAESFLPPDLGESERLARLQRLTDGRRSSGPPLDLAVLERSLQSLPPGRRGEERAARIARQLHAWRREMTAGE
jgi:hypothetical protein